MRHTKRLAFLFVLAFCVLWIVACDSQDGSGEPDGDDITDGDQDSEFVDLCADAECPEYAKCNSQTGECECDDGYQALGGRCVAADPDGDAADGDVPDGDWDEELVDGDADSLDGDALDGDFVDGDGVDGDVGDGDAIDGDDVDGDYEDDTESEGELPLCDLIDAPTLSDIHLGAELVFEAGAGAVIELGTSAQADAIQPDQWLVQSSLSLETLGAVRVFSRLVSDDCEAQVFAFTYTVVDAYAPAPGEANSTAIALDDAAFVGWATGYLTPEYGDDVDAQWRTPDKALGPATTNSADIVCLGRGGQIAMSFATPIVDGEGYDFAVFENSFSPTFLEFAYVEVSSDGQTFVRFDSAYLGDTALGAFGTQEPSLSNGLAGKYPQGYGMPFDLALLRQRAEVLSGQVDLDNIVYVRLVDVVGDGSALDSFGHPIYDPYPTTGSAGFDLDAIGVINQQQ